MGTVQSRPKPPKPSAKRKRDLDDDHDRPLVSGRTIARPRPKTHEIRRQFKERYAVDLSQNVFIGLCAYLQTVVAKGYSVPVTAWDAFVSAYISFPHAQREIAEEQARLQQDSVPAYHVWFEQESHGHETHHRIMNTQVLEELSQECQYFFLRARLAYDVIVAQSTPLTAGRSDLASKAESNSDPTLEVHPPSRHQDRADLAAGGEASGLARSRFSGLKIDHGGRLVNLAGFPSGIGTPDVGKRTKHPWTPDEDAILIEYVMAAQEYGDVPPQQPFQELENLYPQHPWRSWQSRFAFLRNSPPAEQSNPHPHPHPHPPSPGPGPLASASVTSDEQQLPPPNNSPPDSPVTMLQAPSVVTDIEPRDRQSSHRRLDDTNHSISTDGPPSNDILHETCTWQGGGSEKVTEHDITTGTLDDMELTAHISGWYKRNHGLPPLVAYRVPQSQISHAQIKHLALMTGTAKKDFDTIQRKRLAAWGVTPAHKGTCVLVPREWGTAKPLELLKTFSYESCPRSGSRLTFEYGDVSTPWARASVWFADETWPQTGAAFDVLQGYSPYAQMEGSHRCHQGMCINPTHLVADDPPTNDSRQTCRDTARGMRNLSSTADMIPEFCEKHDPPCLMQHASLTFFEAYLVQFWVLCQVHRQPPKRDIHVQSHPFPTFECQLPISYKAHAIALLPDHLVESHVGADSVYHSVVLTCRFCITKGPSFHFKQLPGLWTHIAYAHEELDQCTRLREVRRCGEEYEQTLLETRADLASNTALMTRIQQSRSPDFSWDQLEMWKLRQPKKSKRGKV